MTNSVEPGGGRGPDRSYLEVLERVEPELFAAWASWLDRTTRHRALDPRVEALIAIALDSLVHRHAPYSDRNVERAFEAGSNIAEILELLVRIGLLEGGIHSIHHGLEALERAVVAREAAGLPAPRNGEGLTEADKTRQYDHHGVAGHPYPEPPVYPYQAKRLYLQVWEEYDPELFAAYYKFVAERFDLRNELGKKTEELVVIAVDSLVCWPSPMIDSHLHEAFNQGASIQEVVEAVLAIAQYDRENHGIAHGLSSLDRVIRERQATDAPTPRL